MEVSSPVSHPISPGTSTGTQWIGGWVGSRAGLDIVEDKDLFPMPEINYDSSVVQTAA